MAIVRGITNYQKKERLLGSRSFEDLVEEIHRARSMGEACEPGLMKCCNEKATGQTNRLFGIVGLAFLPIFIECLRLLEDRNQDRRVFKERLMFVGPQMIEGSQPFLWSAVMVEFKLLFLGSLTDFPLDLGALNQSEMPRLLVRTAGGPASRGQTGLEDISRNRIR